MSRRRSRPGRWFVDTCFLTPDFIALRNRASSPKGGEQRFVLVAQIAGAITTVSAGSWAMAQWGALGGAIAMVGSSLIVWFVAHGYARKKVARIPFLAAAARPALAALVVGIAAHQFDGPAWIAAVGAALVFALLGPLLDWRLIADLRSLANAKEGVEAARGPRRNAGDAG